MSPGVSVTMCQEQWPQPGAETWHTCYTFFVLLTTYLLPLGVTAPAYAAVARRLWQRRAPGNADTARDLHQLQSKRRVSLYTVHSEARFPSKRNARKRQPIGMVDRNSQSSKQPIKRLRCLRFSYATQSIALRALRLDGNRA